MDSDEELIGRIAAGDREAFAALYRRRRPDVYRFALHMTGSPAVAEDVVQDVFLALIEQAERYELGRAAVVPWLLGIGRNYIRRALQRQRRTLSLTDEAVEQYEAVDGDPLPAIAQSQHVAAMRRHIAALPIGYREVIVLCDLRGLSYADAATVIGCAVGTVRSRLHRARALLASRVQKELKTCPTTIWRIC